MRPRPVRSSLLDSIDVSTTIGTRHSALFALTVFSFARVGAALAMRVDNVYVQNRRLRVRLVKCGRRHEMPRRRVIGARGLSALVSARYRGLRRSKEAAIPDDRAWRRATQHNVAAAGERLWRSAARSRRASRPQSVTRASRDRHHRVSGNGGMPENVARMANHAPARTTHFYDPASW